MRYDRTIIGYHGTDATIVDQLLAGTRRFERSMNDYDWLGDGVYFWEYGHARALRFAEDQKRRGMVTRPAVVGAVLQLGRCFDLLDTRFTLELEMAFQAWKETWEGTGKPLPINRGATPDKELRFLDRAVLNFYLERFEESEPFQTVRGAFEEGKAVFEGSGIKRETHVQIAVRDPSCIVGVFRPML